MSESHDPWESARGSQREEVQAIWANRGAPAPPPPKQRDWRRISLIAAPVLVGVALVAFVFVPAQRDDADREARNAASAQERLEAGERERLRREGKPVLEAGPPPRDGEDPLAYRERLVAAGEAAITTDARARVETGEIDSEVRGTACRAFPYTNARTEQETDPAIERNRYQCTAFSRRFELPELEGERRTGLIGQPYWLVADYGTGELSFCKISPKAGEGGKVLATVLVAPACRDPL